MYPLVLLSGGLATRLYPITKTVPKAMIPLAGKPFVSHQLMLIKSKGFSHVVICAGYLGEQIRDFVGTGEQYGLSVTYSFEGEHLLGTGGAIKKALPLLSDVFCVMYGDSYLPIDFKFIVDYFSSHAQQSLMTVLKNNNQWDTSNIVFENGTILMYDKKNRSTKMHYIDYGFSILHKEIFSAFADDKAFDLADVFQRAIQNEEMLGYEVNERFYEIGSLQGLEEMKKYLEDRYQGSVKNKKEILDV